MLGAGGEGGYLWKSLVSLELRIKKMIIALAFWQAGKSQAPARKRIV